MGCGEGYLSGWVMKCHNEILTFALLCYHSDFQRNSSHVGRRTGTELPSLKSSVSVLLTQPPKGVEKWSHEICVLFIPNYYDFLCLCDILNKS